MADEFDPASVPIRPAATVMLIRETPVLEVLMMRRHAKTVFAGGMWVFPGGAVDPADFELEIHGQDQIDIPGRTEKPINPFEDRAYPTPLFLPLLFVSGVSSPSSCSFLPSALPCAGASPTSSRPASRSSAPGKENPLPGPSGGMTENSLISNESASTRPGTCNFPFPP